MKRIATMLLVAGLVATPLLALPPAAVAAVSVGISIGIAPPPLPVYAQPVVPGPGYIWTPGYWAWDSTYGNYYWVPGIWVMPPSVGLLWTPGWWGWSTGRYRWHAGYWDTHVGFYGGVNYGFGYFGVGYVGGHWRGRDFYYNRAVSHVNVGNVHNVYVDRTVIRNVTVNRVSYNGGHGGLTARPGIAQRANASGHRWSATPTQRRQHELARQHPAQRFDANGARPAAHAPRRAGNFNGSQAVRQPGTAPAHARAEQRPVSRSEGRHAKTERGRAAHDKARHDKQPDASHWR